MLVTIVMTIREKYSTTLTSMDSLFEHTTIDFRFVFIDYMLPEEIKSTIQIKYPITEIIISNVSYPQYNRNLVIPTIDTEYTIFVDNDVIFRPLWLENLIQCFQETGAGIVGPLYLWNKDKIHMFGGTISLQNDRFFERHEMVNIEYKIDDEKLVRKKCDYVEYHCLGIQTNLLKQIFDPTFKIIHEHIDLSMQATKLGYDTYIEPLSVIVYLNDVEMEDYDYDFYKKRWDIQDMEKDINYFCTKYSISKTSQGFKDIRNFIRNKQK